MVSAGISTFNPRYPTLCNMPVSTVALSVALFAQSDTAKLNAQLTHLDRRYTAVMASAREAMSLAEQAALVVRGTDELVKRVMAEARAHGLLRPDS